MARSATMIALIAFAAQALAKDFMNNLVDKLADDSLSKLFDRDLGSPLHLSDLDDTMLGKPSHLALCTSHLSSIAALRSPSLPNLGLASPVPVDLRSRSVANFKVHGEKAESASLPVDKASELRVAMAAVAREEHLPVQEVEQRFVQLNEILPLTALDVEGVNLHDVVCLAVHAPVDIALRALKLKSILPDADVGKLVARCPRLMDTETDLVEVKAELDAAEARIEGVPRKELGKLMADLLPQVFYKGKPAWNGNSESNIMCACCKEARRLFSCKSNLEAVQRMIKWQYTKVVMRNLEATEHLVASH